MKNSKAAATKRLRDERRQVADSARKEPLRRRLLIALGSGAATPTELSAAVEARKESVSRKLTTMRAEGLVSVTKDSDDRRRTAYSLTREGRSELGRQLAFGAPGRSPRLPDAREIAVFQREALAGAVAMRRRDNRLQDAIDRMQEIYEQAEEAGAHDIALEALAELATTQRQDRRREERDGSLAILEHMAMGAPGVEPQLVYPAIAHLEYERGKFSDMGPADNTALARHLITSMSLFERLIEQPPGQDTRSWRTRRAWSAVSLAHNFRDQSRYDDSLQYAASGLRTFDELEDDYGRTQCWFLFGFCLRLLRRFDAAWSCLEHAHAIACAPANRFERARAFCLVQMGEVRRCQNSTEEAEQLLGEALKEAKRLDLHVARSFATSGLAAVQFQDKELDLAQVTLRSAQKAFRRCKHQEGIALNARRQATVARHLSIEGVKPDEPEIKKLIKLAETTYRALGSPAGVAACEIERGWMRKISPDCGNLDEVVDELNHLVKDERGTLEQDAWVPTVLNEFARKVGGADLAKQARAVYSQSERNLTEQGDQGIQYISGLAEDFEAADKSHPSTRVVEMGGESRRKQQALLAA
jgi:DNA-binding MarR family transcriptional regulator